MNISDPPLIGAPKPKPRIATYIAYALVFVAAISAGIIGVGILNGPVGARYSTYMPVIATVRGLVVRPGEHRRFRLADMRNPATLREDTARSGPERGNGAGTIWAERDTSGRLAVAIEIFDHGHAGEFGYLYADEGIVQPAQKGTSVEGPGREWTLDSYLGNGWWHVSYRLE